MKKILKFIILACICCLTTLTTIGCSSFKSDSKLSKSEWQNAFAYSGKYFYTVSNTDKNFTKKVYIDNNLTKTEITETKEFEKHESIYYTEQIDENCWFYYYDEDESKWRKTETPHNKENLFDSWNSKITYDDFSYNEDTETYIAEDIIVEFEEDIETAKKIEITFENKKLIKLEIILYGDIDTIVVYKISYDTNFIITLPDVETDENKSELNCKFVVEGEANWIIEDGSTTEFKIPQGLARDTIYNINTSLHIQTFNNCSLRITIEVKHNGQPILIGGLYQYNQNLIRVENTNNYVYQNTITGETTINLFNGIIFSNAPDDLTSDSVNILITAHIVKL